MKNGYREPRIRVGPLAARSRAAALILAIRASRGWTQARLARELGVCRATVNRWENGRTEPASRDIALFRALLRRKENSPGDPPGE